MDMASLTEAEKGAVTLVRALDAGDDQSFRDLLLGYSLPAYVGTQDDAYRAILMALEYVEAVGRNIGEERRRLAERLAAYVDSAPEERREEASPAKLMYNMYQLSSALHDTGLVADALVRASERQEAIRTGDTKSRVSEDRRQYLGASVNRYLFHACIMSQSSNRFSALWQKAMMDVRRGTGGVRRFWGIHWSEAFDGICLARNPEKAKLPSLRGLVEALPFLMASLEYEYPDNEKKRCARLLQCVDKFCSVWGLSRGAVLPFLVLSDCPQWSFRVDDKKLTELDVGDDLIKEIRRRMIGVNFDSIIFLQPDIDNQFIFDVAYGRRESTDAEPAEVVFYWAVRDYLTMPEPHGANAARLQLKAIMAATIPSPLGSAMNRPMAAAIIALIPGKFELMFTN